MSGKKHSVKVTILNEDYTIRSEASPDFTRAVAQHLDQLIRQVQMNGLVVETNRAIVLAALQVTSELFEARAASEELSGSMAVLASDVRRLLLPAKRA